MLTRAVLAAAGLAAVPAALRTVHAAEATESISSPEKQMPSDGKIFIHELPIYGEPAPAEFVYIPEKPTIIQRNMEPVEDFIMTGIAHTQSLISVFSDGQSTVSTNLTDFLRYLRDDSGVVPRAAFITVTGLGGLVAAYRGGIFRKALYASVGMAAAASVCYPDQAIDISKQTWIFTKEQAKEFWRPAKFPGKDGYIIKDDEGDVTKQSENKTSEKDVKVADQPEVTGNTQPKEDHGMSNPDDKDMYTTRSG